MTIIWKIIFCGIIAFGSLALVERAAAESVLVPGFSFETPDVLEGLTFEPGQANYPYHDPTDDRFPGTSGIYGFIPGTGDGTQVMLLRGSASGGSTIDSPGSLVTIPEHAQFTLTVAVGRSLLFAPGEVRLSLVVDGMVVASTLVTDFSLGTFVDHTASFTSGDLTDPNVGKGLTIRLSHIAGSGADVNEIAFDNVRLDMLSVPEPSTLAFLGMAASWLFWRRRGRGRGVRADL